MAGMQGGSKEERAALFVKLLGGEALSGEPREPREQATFDYIVMNSAVALVVAAKVRVPRAMTAFAQVNPS